MMTTEAMQTAELSDADLVAESLSGKRDAFGRIVERYQTLICSLAYCATGNVGQSEDLAQETFVTAWTRLPELREPAKLRSWLCGITRFLIGKEFRRLGRQALHRAEPLEAVDEWASPEPLPSDQVISEEERALLWRSIERVPEIYREPLVLFYREHQSIETVARDLELSEDAVKQRLSRGRKLLQEQLLAFVAGALRQTGPGKTFTLGVMAALPLVATSAKAASITAAAGKSGPVAKAVAGGGVLSAFLSAGAMMLLSLFAVFGFAGRWIGRKMGLASQQSLCGRKRIIQFWRTLAVGFIILVLPACLIPNSMIRAHPWVFKAESWAISAFHWLMAVALVIWVWQRRRDARRPEMDTMDANQTVDKGYNFWVTVGMLGPALILGAFLFATFFSDWTLTSRNIHEAEALQLIAQRDDARYKVFQYRDGSRYLEIALPENHRITLATPLDDSLRAALAGKGINYQTFIEDLDFHNGGARGWLVLLSTFIVAAGTVLLLRRPGTQRFHDQALATPRAERREKRILAVCGALLMIATSLLFILYTIAHAAPTISAFEAARIISQQKNTAFEVFQFSNGGKELWITPSGSRRYPAYITAADDSTLARLADGNIAYKTYVQGRDFGFRGPGRWTSFSCSFLLAAGAAGLLLWVGRNKGMRGEPQTPN